MFLAVALLVASSVPGSVDLIFANGFDPAAPGACPSGRITNSNIFYPPGDSAVRYNVDLTQFENIWGHVNQYDGGVPWPGAPGSSPVIESFTKTGYVAAEFQTPVTLPNTATGAYKYVSYYPGPNLTFSISQNCGDFSTTQPGCLATNVEPTDGYLLRWRGSAGNAFYCGLVANTTYYINMRLADPTATGPNCHTGNTCWVHVLRQ